MLILDVTADELRELIVNYVTDYPFAVIVFMAMITLLFYWMVDYALRWFYYSHPVFFFGEKSVEKRIEKYRKEIARLEKSLNDDPRGGY